MYEIILVIIISSCAFTRTFTYFLSFLYLLYSVYLVWFCNMSTCQCFHEEMEPKQLSTSCLKLQSYNNARLQWIFRINFVYSYNLYMAMAVWLDLFFVAVF